jgi:hypothetical protein
MNINKRQKNRDIAFSLLVSIFALAGLVSVNANAQTIPASLNTPSVYDTPVLLGDTSAVLQINAEEAESLAIEVIVPIDDATLSLKDPLGNEVISADDPNIDVFAGGLSDPPLPGGEYRLPTIVATASGTYELTVTFPAATYKTGILATVVSTSAVKTGVIVPAEQFLVGQVSVIGMLIVDTDDRPILGQSPSITVTDPSEVSTEVSALDNGLLENLDGTANDGLYSIAYEFTEVGQYNISAAVSVDIDNKLVAKESTVTVEVVEPSITNVEVAQNVSFGPASCLASLSVEASAENSEAGLYVSTALISDANGNLLEKSANVDAITSGSLTTALTIEAEELLDAGLNTAPFTLVQLQILNFKPESYSLEYLAPAGQWAVPDDISVCAEAIDIQSQLNVTPQLQNGFISSLGFSFDINVQRASNYQITFKITDADNQNVEVFGFSEFLSVGANTISVNIYAGQLQNTDGPFTLESVLVIGGGETGQLSLVGSSEAYSKWQYFPSTAGDLDGDGDVDRADRAILISERRNPVFSPGDRRDLDGNGAIDLRDIRRIRSLR